MSQMAMVLLLSRVCRMGLAHERFHCRRPAAAAPVPETTESLAVCRAFSEWAVVLGAVGRLLRRGTALLDAPRLRAAVAIDFWLM